MRVLSYLLFFICFSTTFCWADGPLPLPNDSTPIVDTLLYSPDSSFADAAPVTNEKNYEQNLTQNPTVALFKSMILPGLGQIGNKRYFKAVLFAGFDSWFIYSAIKHGNDASDLKKQFNAATDEGERNDLHDKYEDKAGTRNFHTWMAVVTTVVAMFDAYVDAHLSGSPTDKRQRAVSFNVPPPIDGTLAASVQINF